MRQTRQDDQQERQTTTAADHTRQPLDLARYRRRRQRRLVWQRVVQHLTSLVLSLGQHSAAPVAAPTVAEGHRQRETQRPG